MPAQKSIPRTKLPSSHSHAFSMVVGYDFSDQGDLALDRALFLAAGLPSSKVDVLTVVSPHSAVASNAPDASFGGADSVMRSLSETVSKRVLALGVSGLNWVPQVRIGEAADEILALAAERRADLVVVGTHGRQGLRRFLLGSVAEKVVQKAHCPVFVTRETHYEVIDADARTPTVEPPCGACMKVRAETGGRVEWCESHSHFHHASGPIRKNYGGHPESRRQGAFVLY